MTSATIVIAAAAVVAATAQFTARQPMQGIEQHDRIEPAGERQAKTISGAEAGLEDSDERSEKRRVVAERLR
ncbi:hypothetical protein [Rhodocyclus gracilis]|uniref:hypothetical protein n=1 Tax=Rhodocyclus gracilis TaxID=2929842 RepID=UPI0030F47C4E